MKLLIGIILAASLFLTILVILGIHGLFSKVKVDIRKGGGEKAVLKAINGDYKQCGKIMNEVYYSLLNNYGIETTLGFAVYYDNPKNTARENLRSEAGCIIDNQYSDRASELDKEFLVKTIESKEYITAEFPYKGQLSVLLGIIKVYPVLEKEAVKKGVKADAPIMEIYDVPGKKIIYRKWG